MSDKQQQARLNDLQQISAEHTDDELIHQTVAALDLWHGADFGKGYFSDESRQQLIERLRLDLPTVQTSETTNNSEPDVSE